MFTQKGTIPLSVAFVLSILFYLFAILLKVTTNEADGIVIFFGVIGAALSLISWLQVEAERNQ